jgi:3-deoxy-7-phosphoheptulonate synthase
MILILKPNTELKGADYGALQHALSALPNITIHIHQEVGTQVTLTEVYLIGDTSSLNLDDMQHLPTVDRVIRVSEAYRVLGRHNDERRPTHFDYNGVRFGQDTLHVFAGLCAVDTPEHVEQMRRR